jgi:nicotinamidase-related amidase
MKPSMSTSRAPVIVIDLQTGMFDGVFEPPLHDAPIIAERVRSVLAWARHTRHKVAFVRHDGPGGDPLAPGAPGWPIWPALGQADDEPTFSKSVADAFSNPELARWLSEQHADEVILLGAQSEHCVAATAKGALAAGLRVTVIADAHSTWDFDGETAAAIIDRQNAAFAAAGANLVKADALVSG